MKTSSRRFRSSCAKFLALACFIFIFNLFALPRQAHAAEVDGTPVDVLDDMEAVPLPIGTTPGWFAEDGIPNVLSPLLPELVTILADTRRFFDGAQSLRADFLVGALTPSVWYNYAANDPQDWRGYNTFVFYIFTDDLLTAIVDLGQGELQISENADLANPTTYDLSDALITVKLLNNENWQQVVVDLSSAPASTRDAVLSYGIKFPLLTVTALSGFNLDGFAAGPSKNIPTEQCREADADFDGGQEQACDTDVPPDGCYGNVYIDPDGSSNDCIDKDGDKDGCSDFFIDTDGTGCTEDCPEVFWDPTQGVLTKINEMGPDTNGDGVPDEMCAFDSNGDGSLDRVCAFDSDGDQKNDSCVKPNGGNPVVGGQGGGQANPFSAEGSGCALSQGMSASAMACAIFGLVGLGALALLRVRRRMKP